MKKFIIVLFFCLLINPAFAVSSITLQNTDTYKVLEVLKILAVNQNHTIVGLTQNSITLSMPTTIMENTLYGTQLSGNPQKICYITVLPSGNSVIVQLTEKMVSNAGTIYQQVTDYNVDEYAYISALNSMFNPRYSYGFSYMKHRKYIQIATIFDNEIIYSDNQNVLKVGDKIIDVKPFGLSVFKSYNFRIDENSPNEIILVVKNDNDLEPREVKIKKNCIKPQY